MRSRLKSKQSELDRLRRSPDPRKKGPRLQQELEAAKKLGLFAVMAAFLAKFAKVAILAVAGFGAAIAKFFKRKPSA